MKFRKAWDTNTPIEWWNTKRRELNSIICRCNAIRMDAATALHLVKDARSSWASDDGCSGYDRALAEMQEDLESLLEEE